MCSARSPDLACFNSRLSVTRQLGEIAGRLAGNDHSKSRIFSAGGNVYGHQLSGQALDRLNALSWISFIFGLFCRRDIPIVAPGLNSSTRQLFQIQSSDPRRMAHPMRLDRFYLRRDRLKIIGHNLRSLGDRPSLSQDRDKRAWQPVRGTAAIGGRNPVVPLPSCMGR